MNMEKSLEDWATATLKEAPYWRDGMSVEEYEVERDYYNQNLSAILDGTYKPLWAQNK